MRTSRLALLLASVALSAPIAAFAQTAAVEEIVVTAQRRGENLQSVPISITAVTASMADRMGVTGPESLTQIAPGVTFSRQAQGGVPFIRGIGTTSSFVGNEPSVALFVDDVYLVSGNAAVFDFNNIEAIEILKGPQGTLFGRNATGGVIHVKTRNPTYQPTLDATATYANYDTVTGQFYGSTGLSDKVAVNLAAYYSHQRDGWGKNFATVEQPSLLEPARPVAPGTDVNFSKSYGVRGKLLFEPSDQTSVLLSGSYSYRHSDQGYANRVVPGIRGRLGYTPDALGMGFYDGVASINSGYYVKFQQYSGKITHDLGAASLVSITSYSRLRVQPSLDLDASPQNFLNSYNHYGADTYTQEVQLLSPEDSTVKWIIGGFYMHDEAFFQGRYSGDALVSNGVPRYQTGDAPMTTNSYSGFAQTTFEVLPRTNMTIGLRYTRDERATTGAGGSLRLFDGTPVVQNGPFYDSETFESLTGRFALDYKVTDDLMVYAAYNRGFKSGVYNLAGYSPAVTSPLAAVRPEEINAYMVGFKSELWDRRVRLNAEAFYYDYKNIQVQNNRPDGGGTIFVNGGAATVKGFDIELTVVPVENLTLTGGVTVLDGHYDKFDNGPTFFTTGANAPIAFPDGCNFTAYPVSGSPMVQILQSATDPRSCSLAGRKTVMTPPLTISLSGSYRIPTTFGDVDLSASLLHSGHGYFEPDNISFSRQPLHDLLNASVRWTSSSERLSLKLWGNNLLSEKYFYYIGNSSTSGTKGAPAAPRTYGITLGVHY